MNQDVTPWRTVYTDKWYWISVRGKGGARLQVEDEPGGDALAHDVHEEVRDGQQPHIRVLHAVLVQQAPQAALGRAAWRRRAAARAQRARSGPGQCWLATRAQRARSAHALSARAQCPPLASVGPGCVRWARGGQQALSWRRAAKLGLYQGPAGRRQLDTESCTYCWGGRIAARLRGAQPPLPCT